MSSSYNVLGIGNAIMDVIAPVDEALLTQEDITKGGRRTVYSEFAGRRRIYKYSAA